LRPRGRRPRAAGPRTRTARRAWELRSKDRRKPGRSLDPVLLHLLPEVLAGDAQRLGGVRAVAVGGFQHPADVGGLGLADDLLERDERRALGLAFAGAAAAAERALEEGVAGEDAGRWSQRDRALDGVLELADVAGPRVGRELCHRLGRDG